MLIKGLGSYFAVGVCKLLLIIVTPEIRLFQEYTEWCANKKKKFKHSIFKHFIVYFWMNSQEFSAIPLY